MTEAALAELRTRVSAHLEGRRAEIEATMQARIRAVSDPGETGDPAYVDGLHTALAVAFDYALAGLRMGDGADVPIPPTLFAQARSAARNGIGLDTVLRRYFMGYALLSSFVMEEVEAGSFSSAGLQRLTRAQASLFDRLIAAVAAEYTGEWERRTSSNAQRRLKRVENLLDGELVENDELEYDFDCRHLGLIARGPGGPEAVRRLACELDSRLLLVSRDEETTWAWLGANREIDPDRVQRVAASGTSPKLRLALGEPAPGLPGWRLTHRQASASMSIAMRRGHGVTCYSDVALLASVLVDEVFAASLRQLFLSPLAEGRDRGTVLLETLRAYFKVERNVSSAAAALGVSRQTVINRLNVVEARLGRPLGACAPELEAAVRLDEFERIRDPVGRPLTAPGARALQPAKLAPAALGRLSTRSAAPAPERPPASSAL